jgi:type IV fimbrial biogenesis protein FimT
VLKRFLLRRNSGFTLIEMMIGITLLAILLAMALPSYRTWIQNAKIRNAAESILDGLQLARSEAVARNSPVEFVLQSGSSWVICTLDGDDCAETIQSRATGEGSSTSVIVTTTPADETKVVFDSLGKPRAATGGDLVTAIDVDVDPSVLSAADSRNLRIVLTSGVKMCDPNVVSPDSRAC